MFVTESPTTSIDSVLRSYSSGFPLRGCEVSKTKRCELKQHRFYFFEKDELKVLPKYIDGQSVNTGSSPKKDPSLGSIE